MEIRDSRNRTYPARPGNVYLYATCLVDQFMPQAGMDAIALLEREGVAVHFPEGQTCCGQPAYTSGYPDEARAVARSQLQLFPQPWPIVVASGSCGATMRHHYPALFANDPVAGPLAREVAERVFELTEFLVHVLGYRPIDCGPPGKVALHTSCHARREMGVHETSRALLENLAHVEVVEQARQEECCGFGGTFAVRHPQISEAIVADKVDALRASGADQVISADCGCLANILGHAAYRDRAAARGKASLPGEHIASFLWRRTNGVQR